MYSFSDEAGFCVLFPKKGQHPKIGKSKNGNSFFSVEIDHEFWQKFVTLQVTTKMSKLVDMSLTEKKPDFF